MSLMQEIYQRIRTLDDPWVTPSLIAALPTADPLGTQFIALVLLEKRDPAASLALIEHFHRLPPELQATVQTNVLLTQATLRTALRQINEPTASNALSLIRQSQMAELSPLLLTLLCPWPNAAQGIESRSVPSFSSTPPPASAGSNKPSDSSDASRSTIPPQLRRDAAECLWTLARTTETPGQADASTLHTLQATIEQALSYYRFHQEIGVLQAWATVAGARGLASSGVLGDPYHMATLRLRELLANPTTPTLRRALLPCLRIPSLAASALRGLHKTMEAGRLNEALTDWHLLLLPRTQLALRRLLGNSPPAKLPRIDENSNAVQMLGLVQWNAALPSSAAHRAEALTQLATLEDPATRLSVLLHLIALSEDSTLPGIHGVIAKFCADSSPVLARLALRHLLRVKPLSLPRVLLQLVNSPHADVRALACENLAPVGFARLWSAWPRLNFAQQISAGKALIKIDPNFHRFLGEKLSRPDRPARLRALAIVHTLNQGPFFEAALLTLASEGDERVASASVRCLGGVNTPKSIEVLELSLRHPDSRVRANAIEALNQLQATHHTQALIEMTSKEENRPRANAIAALLQMRTADALAALTNMLHDARPEHRTSALWLVETLGLLEVARHVAEISLTDTDAQVQARANKVIRGLIAASPLQKKSDQPEPAAPVFRTRNAS